MWTPSQVLQRVQNTAARLILCFGKIEHITLWLLALSGDQGASACLFQKIERRKIVRDLFIFYFNFFLKVRLCNNYYNDRIAEQLLSFNYFYLKYILLFNHVFHTHIYVCNEECRIISKESTIQFVFINIMWVCTTIINYELNYLQIHVIVWWLIIDE